MSKLTLSLTYTHSLCPAVLEIITDRLLLAYPQRETERMKEKEETKTLIEQNLEEKDGRTENYNKSKKKMQDDT